MPWFITSIREEKASYTGRVPEHRTLGFYSTLAETEKAIVENRGEMREKYYDFIVVEYMEPGIFPRVIHVDWWDWDNDSGRWERLLPEFWPENLKNITNWAIG